MKRQIFLLVTDSVFDVVGNFKYDEEERNRCKDGISYNLFKERPRVLN